MTKSAPYSADTVLASTANFARLGPVCRLGLASRGNTHLPAEHVHLAIERGINVLNWCGYPDGVSQAITQLGARRADVKVVVQFEARSADDARRELEQILIALNTDYVDVLTYYYVQSAGEWDEIASTGGAAEVLELARDAGRVRAIGLTTHDRQLAAEWARSGRLDCLMVRYNAAHRGAEEQVFPTTTEQGISTICFTGLRWGALLQATPDDPPGTVLPTAPECYRFVLSNPAVSVALMAPDTPAELAENLTILDDWRGLTAERYQQLREHGDRVRRHGGQFP